MNAHTKAEVTKPNIIAAEPVITAAVGALIVKGIALAVEFGAPITEGQADAINAFSTALMVIIFLAVRWFVTSKARVVEQTKTIEGKEVIVAGEANDILATGMKVRKVGERPDTPVAGIEKP